MGVTITSIDRFTKLKQQRDALSKTLATLEGRVASSRDRYNDIMRELASFGIGSMDELRSHITDLDRQINAGLVEAEQMLNSVEVALKALDNQEVPIR